VRVFFATIVVLLVLTTTARTEQKACEPRAEYVRYCASCHGEEADGNGRVAGLLNPRPPALTSLHKKFGNPLGTDLVVFLVGTTMPRAHGTSAMPVWGREFGKYSSDPAVGDLVLWRIVHHLECIQTDE
jgi:mono/diheme cytochrome c family protein